MICARHGLRWRVFLKRRLSRLKQILCFLFVFFVGFLGFLLFRRLKIPTSGLLGSIFATGILNAAGYYPEFEIGTFSFLAKAATGVMLGRRINRELFVHIKDIAAYVLLVSIGMLVVSLVTGYTIYYMLPDVSLATALIGGAAGGIAEMTAFGISMKEDVVTILFMQLLRVLFAIMLSHWIALLVGKAVPGKNAKPQLRINTKILYFYRSDYVLLAGVAFLGAWLFNTLKVPNGIMMGAMLASGFLAVFIRKTYRFGLKASYAVQISLGLIIGQYVTPEVIGGLQRFLLPGLASVIVTLTGSVTIALILNKVSPLDAVTCVLCTSPAGLTQIAFISEEMGADPLTTSIFQVCRLVSIIAFYPWIVQAIV